MPVEFPLGTKVIALGRIANPVIPILVLTRNGYLPFDFLVDTGADCSMIPAAIAETELGVHLAQCPQDTFLGIEGRGLRVYQGWLSVKIGPYPLRARCVFSPHAHSPLILGRMGVFDHFTMTFDNRRHLIRFTKLPRRHLSSIATQVLARPPSLRSIAKEVTGYRRAKRTRR